MPEIDETHYLILLFWCFTILIVCQVKICQRRRINPLRYVCDLWAFCVAGLILLAVSVFNFMLRFWRSIHALLVLAVFVSVDQVVALMAALHGVVTIPLSVMWLVCGSLNPFAEAHERMDNRHRLLNRVCPPLANEHDLIEQALDITPDPDKTKRTRKSAEAYIQAVADVTHRPTWSLSMSSQEQREGRSGQRFHRSVPDMHRLYQDDEIQPTSLITMTDVDYYLDHAEIARYAFEGNPMMFYTWNPSQPNGVAGHIHFSYSSKSKRWNFRGNGLQEYSNQLWDWGRKPYQVFTGLTGARVAIMTTLVLLSVLFVLGEKWFFGALSLLIAGALLLTTAVVTVKVHVIPWNKHHSVVVLQPKAIVPMVYSYIVDGLMSNTLTRLECYTHQGTQSAYNVLKVLDGDTAEFSVGHDEGSVSVNIPSKLVDSVSAFVDVQKTPVSVGVATRLAADCGVNITAGDGAVMLAALRSPLGMKVPIVHVGEPQNYTINPTVDSDNAKPGMREYMTPILKAGAAPTNGPENARAAVQLRVEDQKVYKNQVRPFMVKAASDFGRQLRSLTGRVVPASDDEIAASQNRPEQRRIIDSVRNLYSVTMEKLRPVVTAFMKREFYGFRAGTVWKVKAPRNITMSNTYKDRFSAYCLALGHGLKVVKWYAFGQTPDEVSEAIPRVLHGRDYIIETDFSKFDGTISRAARTVESIIYSHWLEGDEREEFLKLLAASYDNTVYLGRDTDGVSNDQYEQETTRGSGFADTSLGNSLLNAFVTYYAIRKSRKRNGTYYSHVEAWSSLGIYGGDDGLSGTVDPDLLMTIAEEHFGLKLKSTVRRRDQNDCVTFLARVWGPGAWAGDSNNMCDVPRQLAKLHMTTQPVKLPGRSEDDTNKIVLLNKALSYEVTDRNTPLIGPWSVKMLALLNDEQLEPAGVQDHSLGYYASLHRHGDEKRFHNERADWMESWIAAEMEDPNLMGFETWLGTVTLANILKPPIIGNLMSQVKPEGGSVLYEGVEFGERSVVCSDCKKTVDAQWIKSITSVQGNVPPKRCQSCCRNRKAGREKLTEQKAGPSVQKEKEKPKFEGNSGPKTNKKKPQADNSKAKGPKTKNKEKAPAGKGRNPNASA